MSFKKTFKHGNTEVIVIIDLLEETITLLDTANYGLRFYIEEFEEINDWINKLKQEKELIK